MIFRIDTSQPVKYLEKIAGTGVRDNYGDNGPAVDAGISEPGPIAVDTAGDVHFGSSSGDIREVDSSGEMRDVITLPAGVTSLAFGSAGQLYASLSQGNTVMKVSGLAG